MSGPARHPGDDVLQEWLDGALDPAEADRVVSHVAGCATCRAEADRLRDLLDALRSLPRGMTPPASMLADARARAVGAGVVPLGAGRSRTHRRGLAAAAVALVVVGTAATVLLGPSRKRAADAPAAPAAVLRVTDDYDRAVTDLSAALEARRGELDPATVRIVEENLRIVDRALAEARAALAADPSDPVLRDLVVAGYEQKLDLLRRATRPPGEI